jgi:hypothetical protein
MAEQVVRCPYCVLGDHFRPMLQRPEWYVCEQCGHTMIPDDPEFKCSCAPGCVILALSAISERALTKYDQGEGGDARRTVQSEKFSR